MKQRNIFFASLKNSNDLQIYLTTKLPNIIFRFRNSTLKTYSQQCDFVAWILHLKLNLKTLKLAAHLAICGVFLKLWIEASRLCKESHERRWGNLFAFLRGWRQDCRFDTTKIGEARLLVTSLYTTILKQYFIWNGCKLVL